VCLPVLIAVVLGSIEASNLIHVQHALKAAAYEAARTAGSKPATTTSQLTNLAQTVLDIYQVEDGRVTITPEDLSAVPTGGQVTVSVTAPVAVNRVISGWAPQWLLGNSDLSAQCTVVRG
jgi:Flp pilus assembly protein TadG